MSVPLAIRSHHFASGRDLRTACASLWLLVFAATLASGCRQSPALPRLAHDDVVLAFGDSLTYGTGADPQESYPEVLAGLIGRKVVRDGAPGETTAEGLQRLEASLDEHRPRLLLLCMGGNDLLRKVEPAVTEANLRSMIQLARSRGLGVVLIGVPEPRLFGGVAAFYDRIADDLDLPLEDSVLPGVLRDNGLKSDAIHPNAQGYRRMAEAVAELLQDAGAL
jgi:lysophospholipase L1-like esterase